MKILFLDDSTERIKVVKNRLGHKQNVLDIATSVPKAISLLKKNSPYDLVMLDHDLGDHQILGEKTGLAVVKFITEMKSDKTPKRIIIHSHNPVGAQRMKTLLQINHMSADIFPFSERLFIK